ncbi:MAG: peptide-methionine (R)-S-oxide reductase MsrB [Arenimonas sp.]
MNRRNLLISLAAVTAAASWLGISSAATTTVETIVRPLKKSKAEWQKILPAAVYGVLFEENTERPNSSELNNEHRGGTFICAACYLPLFSSNAKFDSGTGWPSFSYPIEGHIAKKTDFKLVFPRTEYHCARCGGHQGHVFDDGPKPTGQRWCNNGLALKFIQKGSQMPALRV